MDRELVAFFIARHYQTLPFFDGLDQFFKKALGVWHPVPQGNFLEMAEQGHGGKFTDASHEEAFFDHEIAHKTE